MEDGIWGGIADGGRCTESGVDDSEWSGLEKRRRGMLWSVGTYTQITCMHMT